MSTFPYRHVKTGQVQLLTDEQAEVFPGQFEKLADDYEALEAAAAEAQAALDTAESRDEKREAKAAVKETADAAAAAIVTPADAPTETPEGA